MPLTRPSTAGLTGAGPAATSPGHRTYRRCP